MQLVVCVPVLMVILTVNLLNGQTPDANVQSEPLDETSVLKMGRQFRNPLLRLLGTAMWNSKRDVLGKICSLYRCGEWSDWSPCPVKTREDFGMITRSRECGKGPSFCKSNASQIISTEMDSKVCIGEKCPAGFNGTDNGFCFLFHTTGMNRDDAEKFCKEKSGFVINLSTKLKSDDLHEFLQSNGITSGPIWLNARRKDINSTWELSYEARPGDHGKWQGGEPSNGVRELCVVEVLSQRLWYDRECADNYKIVCEFV